MGTAATIMGQLLAPKTSLEELLKVVVLPSSAELTGRAVELIRSITSILDESIATAIESRTAEDFRNVTLQLFPQYFTVMRALGDLERIIIPKQTMDRLNEEWFCQLGTDFREVGLNTFGSDLAEWGLFTAWILRRISNLAVEVSQFPSARGYGVADMEMAADFAAKVFWTRFHVDCLVRAMRDNKPICPEVIEPIRDGLRMAINTYVAIRQWADFRNPRPPDPELEVIQWTEEDEVLLLDSLRDLDDSGLDD